jgi:hypothetical protein
MNCKQAREYLLDVASGAPIANNALQAHVQACADCAKEVAALRRTMSLLDEWKAPEPSPYFSTRLRARLQEESTQSTAWLAWLRRPALALAMIVLLVGAVLLFRSGERSVQPVASTEPSSQVQIATQAGSAVGDLETLEQNQDLLANFELLDEINGEQEAESR